MAKNLIAPAIASVLSMSCFYSVAEANNSPTLMPIDNPIVLQRADPWLVRDDKTGCYTFIGTSPKFDEIELRQACRINDLKLAEPKVIWHKNEKGPMSTNIWAPELHNVDGSWYIHFAAGDVEKPFSIRMYVLKNEDENPLNGQWQEMGQLKTHLDSFSLDATTFSHNGKRYLVWAQQNQLATYNSALWIAQMDSPTSIKEPIVTISEPTLDWEIQGYKVNEGAAVIKHDNKVMLTYSASATDDRYAMGLLWADDAADLLDPASWHKKQQPIFASNEKVWRFGPGHNSFVKAEDGVTDLLIYHSRDYKELQGTPLTDPNRHARARIIKWDDQGFPLLSNEKGD
ncbi:family 43 glycosylhydrolase [Pseudoalteromonas sp. BSi20495]|uniref:glycoside hydrolase family 43 protein n=1 Tax=Pseudoalteromonas sp. BSi20495 TaxID=386429 RepID=UPI0002315BF4|nr:family 43 glycosylhydrolase [Pseudoalteromonas sp. BSi20495]GAA77677.1 alpha-N-arabinofuranosidase 2 [Pseudoalteromonas sp. BSi20495]